MRSYNKAINQYLKQNDMYQINVSTFIYKIKKHDDLRLFDVT